MLKIFDHHKKTSVLILSAGHSSRMGCPKFMLQFDENHTFLENIIEGYLQFGCHEIIVVLNANGAEIFQQSSIFYSPNVKIAINPMPDRERFFSIQIGLFALKNPKLVFIHPVDNPFVHLEVLESLFEKRKYSDYQIPDYHGKGGHPILISKNIIKKTMTESDGNINFRFFLSQFSQFRVKLDNMDVLCNINTLDEYQKFIIQRESNQNEVI